MAGVRLGVARYDWTQLEYVANQNYVILLFLFWKKNWSKTQNLV